MGVLAMLSVAPALHAQSNCRSGTAVSNPTSNPGLVADCEALLTALDDLRGTSLNWRASEPIVNWEGVWLGGTPSRVTELNLSSSSLSGSIPTSLGKLSTLERLSLNGNNLSGTIPSSLGNLRNLRILSLYENKLSGTIPRSLGNLRNLRILSLYENKLSGSIPSSLGNLTNLTYLYLTDNRLSGSIPSSLGNLSTLERLYLNINNLRGSIPSSLGNLTNLTHLTLRSNNLSGSIPSELGQLTNLTHLYLHTNNNLSGDVSPLVNLTNLSELFLHGTALSGCVPEALRPGLSDYDLGTLLFCDGGPGKPSPSAHVSFVGAGHDVVEGASVSITVTLSAPLAGSVAVPITATPRGATHGHDYALAGLTAGALVFVGGDLERTFTVVAHGDADGDHDTVVLGFGTLPDRVTAGSPATSTVRIEDDERPALERITRVNEALMPHVAQATTATAINAISGRIAAAGAAAVQDGGFDTAGLQRLYQAVAAHERRRPRLAGTASLPSGEQVLGDTAFAFPLAAAAVGAAAGTDHQPAGISVPTVWGTGDYRSLGSVAGGGEAVAWSGSLFSAHLGFDVPLGERLLGGVALAWSRGAFDYTDRHAGRTGTGTHGTWTVSAHPYVSWTPVEALGLWATVGYGGGQLAVAAEAADVQSSAISRIAAGGGMQATLSDDEMLLPGGITSVTARGEGAYTWTDVAGRALIEPLTVQVWRGRFAVEGAHDRQLPRGSRLRPAVEVAVRYDGGEGMAGAGVEIGAGLRYAAPWGLALEGHGRMLVAHQSGYREWAAGGRLNLDLAPNRQGFSASVAPSYGATASGVDRLWDGGAAAVATSATGTSAPQGRVDAELSYGILAADEVLFIPYGGITAVEDGTWRYQVGGKLELEPDFGLTIEGAHDAAPSGDANQTLSIDGRVRL